MRKTLQLIIIIITIFGFFSNTKTVHADITVDISAGTVSALSTVVLDFESENNDDKLKAIGKDISQIIKNDLSSSKLFRMINPKSFLRAFETVGSVPNFNDWQAIKTKVLVLGKISERDDKKLRIEFHVWDIALQEQKESGALITTSKNYRRIAHMISDYIYTAMTGESGYFDTRIVYISETG
ncbi:MAG: hypothetical protein LBU68_02020, partial [Rickettsiales bacterium]|nr:hypothetical protein [Rickettsiales bacterium]